MIPGPAHWNPSYPPRYPQLRQQIPLSVSDKKKTDPPIPQSSTPQVTLKKSTPVVTARSKAGLPWDFFFYKKPTHFSLCSSICWWTSSTVSLANLTGSISAAASACRWLKWSAGNQWKRPLDLHMGFTILLFLKGLQATHWSQNYS